MMLFLYGRWLLLVGVISFCSGCVSQTPLYNYAGYSSSYYKSVKTPNEETSLKLKTALESAIESSEKSRSGRVAPGIYANLGYLYLKGGDTQKAIKLFNQEKTSYPESSHFMDRVIQKAELMAKGASK